jgi:hypothetical protein
MPGQSDARPVSSDSETLIKTVSCYQAGKKEIDPAAARVQVDGGLSENLQKFWLINSSF